VRQFIDNLGRALTLVLWASVGFGAYCLIGWVTWMVFGGGYWENVAGAIAVSLVMVLFADF
jgi:hypothetical protein